VSWLWPKQLVYRYLEGGSDFVEGEERRIHLPQFETLVVLIVQSHGGHIELTQVAGFTETSEAVAEVLQKTVWCRAVRERHKARPSSSEIQDAVAQKCSCKKKIW
jgi:hypothetical protein